MSAQFLMGPGVVSPPLDGKTPVFEEVGAIPDGTYFRPPGSIVRFGTDYYWQAGSLTEPIWILMGTAFSQAIRDPVRVQLAAPATTVDLPGLDGNTDGAYEIYARVFGNPGVGPFNCSLQFNGGALTGTRASNILSVNGAAPIGAGQNSFIPAVVWDSLASTIRMTLSARTGFGGREYVSHASEHTGAGTVTARYQAGILTDDATNIASLRFVASSALGFGVGSIFSVQPMRGARG